MSLDPIGKQDEFVIEFIIHPLVWGRDAGQAFEFLILNIMSTEVFAMQGLLSPCHYYAQMHCE